VLLPVVEELQALHAEVRVLCTKIGMRPADLGKATQLNAKFKGLDYADVAVLVTLASSGSLRALTRLELDCNQIGDPGMIEFSRSITSGSMANLTVLGLSSNKIGDAGMIELSRAIAIGSLRQLTTLGLNYNQSGDIGMITFAEALQPTDNFPMGSLPACKMILVEHENPGNAAPMKAACEERGIACM
jgi:hypothetical protein